MITVKKNIETTPLTVEIDNQTALLNIQKTVNTVSLKVQSFVFNPIGNSDLEQRVEVLENEPHILFSNLPQLP